MGQFMRKEITLIKSWYYYGNKKGKRILKKDIFTMFSKFYVQILTNITIVSQKLIASIPRCDFYELTHVTQDAALKEGNIVEKNISSLNFDIIWLMNDGTNMNIPTDYCSSMIWRLTSINLIMNIRSIELRGEWWKI